MQIAWVCQYTIDAAVRSGFVAEHAQRPSGLLCSKRRLRASVSMAVSIKVTIRPTTGGGEHNFSVNVPADASVLHLKQKTAEHEKCTLDAKQQRLVFKGKILADEQEISEYGAACSRRAAPCPASLRCRPSPARPTRLACH